MKYLLRKWLFADEVKTLKSLSAKAEQVMYANMFLIEQGKRYCQHQINNPKENHVPRSLMGYGLQTAAKHLGCKSLQWERQWKKEQEDFMKRLTEKTGIKSVVGKRVFHPAKTQEAEG